MAKRNEIRVQTRKKLIEAFWTLYAEKGIERIRIKEITDLAGYHRETFYEYYTDIYDLLEQEESDLIQKITVFAAAGLSAEGVTQEVFTQIAGFYSENGERLNLLINGGSFTFMDRFKEALFPFFQEISKIQDERSARLIFEFLSSGVMMALRYRYLNREDLSLEQFLCIMRPIVADTVLPVIKKLQPEQPPDKQS